MDTAELVKHSKRGDREAFGQLYNIYAPSMTSTIEAIVHDNDVAQDILHDGFIIAFSSIAGLHNPHKFKSWLTTIMTNLSLQYLRKESNHFSTSIADISSKETQEEEAGETYLSWDELNRIIDQLPKGYGKVFRLAVLDGLSHKEIGKILGIAPHSSSSQLHRAKEILRKLITEYRISIGVVCMTIIVTVIGFIKLGLTRHPESGCNKLITKGTKNNNNQMTTDENNTKIKPEDIVSSETIIEHRISTTYQKQKVDVAELKQKKDSTTVIQKDSVEHDTITIPRNRFTGGTKLLANNHTTPHSHHKGWSMSLSYTGNTGQNGNNRYKVLVDPADPDMPSEVPEEIEINEQSRHYMPVVIGLSLNKPLSSKWSIETGVRYSFLRSDYLRESRIETSEHIHRIHYIGIPLKFNYHIFGNTQISMYAQGGATLDVPIRATQLTTKTVLGGGKPKQESLNVSAPAQWSVEGGLGLQYHFTPSFSIYAEPELRYYFNSGAKIRTIRQDKQLEFSIPIGVRLTW